MKNHQADPDGYDIPALYADNQRDDTLDPVMPQPLTGYMVTAIQALAALYQHPEFGKCASPIEQLMLGKIIGRWPTLKIQAQAPIGRFRVDFLLNDRLVIECDGREFHSLPHHQVRDRERDQALRGRGYSVLRFTGAAIHDPQERCLAAIDLVLGNT